MQQLYDLLTISLRAIATDPLKTGLRSGRSFSAAGDTLQIDTPASLTDINLRLIDEDEISQRLGDSYLVNRNHIL